MRITHIFPESFGRGLPLLSIPSDNFVVIFGNNESGKSTYLDLLTSLLSNRTDLKTLYRHGSEKDKIRGEIRFTDGIENLRIEFSKSASIGKKEGPTARTVSNEDSVLWAKIKDLNFAEILNFYRVDAIEILASLEKTPGKSIKSIKDKFRSYASGDRQGVNITETIAEYRELASKNLTMDRSEKKGRDALLVHAQDIEVDIRRAEKKSQDAQDILKKQTAKEQNYHVLDLKKNQIVSQITALNHSRIMFDEFSEFKENKIEIERLSKSDLLLPAKLKQISNPLQTLCSDLQTLLKESHESKLTALETGFADQKIIVNDLKKAVGLEHENPEDLRDMTYFQNSESEYAELITYINNRKHWESEISLLKLAELRAEQAGLTVSVYESEQNWIRLGNRNQSNNVMQPEEFLQRPELSPNNLSHQAKSDWLEFAVLAFAAFGAIYVGISSVSPWRVGLSLLAGVFLGVFALKTVWSKRSRKLLTSSEPIRAQESTIKLAMEIVSRRTKLADCNSDLAKKEAQQKEAESKRQDSITDICSILEKWKFPKNPKLTTEQATDIKKRIDNFFTNLNSLRKLAESIETMNKIVESEHQRFMEISKSASELLREIGFSIELSKLGIKSAAERLSQILVDFDLQESLRASIQTTSTKLDQLPKDLKNIVISQLEMTSDERENLDHELQSMLEEQQKEIDDLQDEINDLAARRKMVEATSELPELRTKLASTRAEISELEIEIAMLRVQESILDRLAKIRNSSALPRLESRLREIALAAAPDWENTRFDSEKDEFYVRQNGKEIRDNELSAGALSLLFMAIRLAIILEEDSKDDAIKIPLLCDDPLLHLDENRTRNTFEMMVRESNDRQTIYFTCRPDILALASNLSLPIVKIGV